MSRGRPDRGLSEVLYVRLTASQRKLLDARVERERRQHPGRLVTIADVVREALAAGLAKGA